MATEAFTKVKELLDRDCFIKIHDSHCQTREANLKFYHSECGVCPRNLTLAQEIVEGGGLVITN